MKDQHSYKNTIEKKRFYIPNPNKNGKRKWIPELKERKQK